VLDCASGLGLYFVETFFEHLLAKLLFEILLLLVLLAHRLALVLDHPFPFHLSDYYHRGLAGLVGFVFFVFGRATAHVVGGLVVVGIRLLEVEVFAEVS